MKTGFSAQSKRQYRRDFKILTLDSKTKKTILKNVVLENKKDAKNNNIKEQKTPTGGAWKPRKKPKFKVSRLSEPSFCTYCSGTSIRSKNTNKGTEK